MKINNKFIALAIAALALCSLAAPSYAKDQMHRKGGYVHAHTMMTKSGKVVKVKGHYRHASNPMKMGGKMSSKMKMPKM